METHTQLILLVDDDAFLLELMTQQLHDLGWPQVLQATSGTQALQQYAQHGADIAAIISDLSMPDMDGLVLMRHLVQQGYGRSIILMSGLANDILNSAHALAQAHGLDILGHLTKPCTLAQLQQLLATLKPSPPTPRPRMVPLAQLPSRLQAALDGGEFVAWYQPKVNLGTGQTVGVEALARWPQADGSMINPGMFVPALESAGLIGELFYAMARQVAADMAQWRSLGLQLKAAINLSMDTAQNLDMPERLLHLVRQAGLAPQDFVIEVTESRLMVDRSVTMESLTRLSLMGFTLSVDDFGTGYSSLIQLIDLPFKELKIDGSFVQRASHEPKAQSAVCLSLVLGLTLKMEVVAEGVETAEQLEFLRNSGCTTVQGYHLARPMPEPALRDWLQAGANASAHTHT
ncbi:EAL domain-containing response regulator [Rhodoferax sp.]|uniref:EAL domain-containing response regulator n=1 Tax=Rhodoferax sp. TaxID=50421 RepID=UPI0026193DCF|nr:EAL domain-containing response regulator [Rhodoferax sp.]MDD2808621.1 EAL domain-containing response regulator [Rhodoferax sp.]MDD4942108.1 EAL domain-containing response regulator [Rhodoferax sp.]